MKTILFLCLVLVVCSAGRIINPHTIVGGRDADPGEIPWIVDLHSIGEDYFCGGSILDKRTILTAAHCIDWETKEDITVHVGSLKRSSNGYNISVASIIQHELFNPENIDNDIALLKLSSDIPIDGKIIAAVNLPPAQSDPFTGLAVLVAGWGSTEQNIIPENLQAVNVNIVSRDKCKIDLKEHEITDRMICADVVDGGKDACGADSGGPLTYGNTQVGIVSWGIGCGTQGQPGVYARVGSYIDWINKNRL